MINFKGDHFPKSVILYAVFFYVRYGVSYRDLEEIMAERGVEIDHATLNRWVVKFSLLIAANAQARKKPTAVSWRVRLRREPSEQDLAPMVSPTLCPSLSTMTGNTFQVLATSTNATA
jgi:hypothetical protein